MDKYTLSLLISERTQQVNWASFSVHDWNLLLSLAESEGVAPILYWQLSTSGKSSIIADSVITSLRNFYAGTWAQNQKILKELGLLTDQFQQAGIQSVVLKGACFMLTIYPDIGTRPMGDLDILVPGSQFPVAIQIANSMGYKDLLPEASRGLRGLLNHEIFLVKADAVPLEIHHSLVADKTYTYAVPVDWFWEQTEPLNNGVVKNTLMLTPTAQLLYAASHAMLQHGESSTPLRWYYDLDLLIRRYQERLDWELLLIQANTFSWGSALNAALNKTCLYFDTPLPDWVRPRLSLQTDRLQALVEIKRTRPSTHVLEEYQKILSLNWAGRFRLISALIFPNLAYMRWRYQFQTIWALPFYYLIRWWGILVDGFLTVIGFAFGRSK